MEGSHTLSDNDLLFLRFAVHDADDNPKQISNAEQKATPAKTISAVVPSRDAFESSNLVLANIGSLPEPFTVILLALGSITLFSHNRRKTRKIKATIKNILF